MNRLVELYCFCGCFVCRNRLNVGDKTGRKKGTMKIGPGATATVPQVLAADTALEEIRPCVLRSEI